MFIPSFLNYRAAKINISIESSKENPKINIRRYHYFKDRASREQKESLTISLPTTHRLPTASQHRQEKTTLR
jgi:hypothetical protein